MITFKKDITITQASLVASKLGMRLSTAIINGEFRVIMVR